MGSVPFLDSEKLSWIRHNVVFDSKRRKAALSLLNNFYVGQTIQLCAVNRSFQGFNYQHFFLSNDTWVFEFDGDDIYTATVNIHCRPKPSYSIELETNMTEDMRTRMRQLLGMKNYSLCLRNCEHVANYVLRARWLSSQMIADKGPIMNYFKGYFMGDMMKLINTFPDTLREEFQRDVQPVYDRSFFTQSYQFRNMEYYLDELEDTYNVVVLGPTGAGKSKIINTIFNSDVCESKASLKSVTKEVAFIRGEAKIGGRMRQVVLADTVGFCDSELKDEEIISLVKSRVESNMAKVDVVVFVLPQRLEQVHIQCITTFMDWLDYPSHKPNFMFIINKCDGLSKEEQERLRDDCRQMLKLGETRLKIKGSNQTLDMVATTGFPNLVEGPRGQAQVLESFQKMTHALFIPPATSNIDLTKSSWCSIL